MHFHGKKSDSRIPFMVRYLPDRWQAGLTTNGKSKGYETPGPFALRYRRLKRTFYETINRNWMRLLIHLTDEKVQNSSAQPVVLCSHTNRYTKAMVKTIKKTLREFNHPVSVFHLPSALSESPVLLHPPQ